MFAQSGSIELDFTAARKIKGASWRPLSRPSAREEILESGSREGSERLADRRRSCRCGDVGRSGFGSSVGLMSCFGLGCWYGLCRSLARGSLFRSGGGRAAAALRWSKGIAKYFGSRSL